MSNSLHVFSDGLSFIFHVFCTHFFDVTLMFFYDLFDWTTHFSCYISRYNPAPLFLHLIHLTCSNVFR